MAKSPTAADLGTVQADPSRATGSYDVSPLAAGGAAMARGEQQLGAGLESVGKDLSIVDQNRGKTQFYDAFNNATADGINLKTDLHDKPYDQIEGMWDEGAKKIIDTHAAKIDNPKFRERFLDRMDRSFAAQRSTISAWSRAGRSDYTKSVLETERSNIVNAQGPDSDPLNVQLIEGHHSKIDQAVANGDLTAREGLEFKQRAAKDIAFAKLHAIGRQGGTKVEEILGGPVTPEMKPRSNDTDFLRDRAPGARVEGVNPVFGSRMRNAMEDFEAETGERANVISLKRTPEEQAGLRAKYEAGTGLPAAKPGTSRHEVGEGADLPSGRFRDWMKANGSKYGVEFLKGSVGASDPGHVQMARDTNAPVTQLISPQQREALIDNEMRHRRANEIDENRAEVLADKKRVQISHTAKAAYIQDFFSDNPTKTSKDIANDVWTPETPNGHLTPEHAENLIHFYEHENKPEAANAVSQDTVREMYPRIRAPYGTPNKILNDDEILKAYNDKKLTSGHMQMLIKSLNDQKSPEGIRIGAKVEEMVKAVTPQITRSDMAIGGFRDTKAGERAFQYRQEVEASVANAISRNEDPFKLFIEGEKGYLGSPAIVDKYKKSAIDAMRDWQVENKVKTLRGLSPGMPGYQEAFDSIKVGGTGQVVAGSKVTPPHEEPFDERTLKTREEIVAAATGAHPKISAERGRQLLLERRLAGPPKSAPIPVSTATPAVPMSQ